MKIKNCFIALLLCLVMVSALCVVSGCSEGEKYFNGTWKVVYRQYNDGNCGICDNVYITVKNKQFNFKSTQNESFESAINYQGSAGHTTEDGINFNWGFSMILTDKNLECSAHVVSDGVLRFYAWELQENDDPYYYVANNAVWLLYLVRCNDDTSSFAGFDKNQLNGTWNRYVNSNSTLNLNYSAETWSVADGTINIDYALKDGGNDKSKIDFSWKSYTLGEYAFTGNDSNNNANGFICVSADSDYNRIYVMYINNFQITNYSKSIVSNSVASEFLNFAVLTK